MICRDCKNNLSESEFYINYRQGTFYSYCKECLVKRNTRYLHSAKGRAMRNRNNKKYFSTRVGKDAWNRASKKSRLNHPERWKARTLLKEAVRKGLLKRLPCEICGREPSQGHHEDYNYPLSVNWYCAYHHRKRHEEIKNETL